MKTNKAENYNSPLLSELMKEISPAEKKRTAERMLLAARIAELIKSKGWTRKEFAKKLGKDNPSEITKWLSGTHNFTFDTIVDISRVLGISLSKLFDQETKPLEYEQYIIVPVGVATTTRSTSHAYLREPLCFSGLQAFSEGNNVFNLSLGYADC